MRRFLQAGAGAVKIEAAFRAPLIRRLVQMASVLAHRTDTKPASHRRLQGARAPTGGKAPACCAPALELPALLRWCWVYAGRSGKRLTSANIPTIGIGAGPGCDGQIVLHDMLGLSGKFQPKFVNLCRWERLRKP